MMRQIKLSKIALMATIRNGFAVGVTLVAVLTPLHARAAVWYDGQHPVSYYVEKNAEPVVTIASQMFSSDMKAVTDKAAILAYKQNL